VSGLAFFNIRNNQM